MKKKIAIILSLVMVIALVAACAANEPPPPTPVAPPAVDTPPAAPPPAAPAGNLRVGIINNPPEESGYREANVRSFREVFTAANGYDVMEFFDINNDPQLGAARQFIADGVDVLLISAAETTGWDSVLRDAQEAGIRVFLFDRMIDVDHNLFEAAVVSYMRAQGEIAVGKLADLMARDGIAEFNIIHIQGAMGSDAQIGRTNPLNEAVAANANWNIVTQQTATWDEGQAQQIVEAVIAAGTPFNVIYAENDGMARGAVTALQAAGISHGRDGDVVILGFDANTWALQSVLDGDWTFNIQSSPFQAEPIHRILQGELTVPASRIIFSDERGFCTWTITPEDIVRFGI